MIKVKVSYERREELDYILKKLQPNMKRWKIAGKQKGKFKRAYIDLEYTE